MIPMVDEDFINDAEEDDALPSRDYAFAGGKTAGFVEELEAVKQAIQFILATERYEYMIYPWEYGVEFSDLVGMPVELVIPKLELRITEALLQDDRIESVEGFVFSRPDKKSVLVNFTVNTIFGSTEEEVSVNV